MVPGAFPGVLPGTLPDDAGRDPVPLGEALDSALSRRFQGKLLDLELLRLVWREAVGPRLADAAFPVGFERGVVTVRAAAPEVARSLERQRAGLRKSLLEACRLPHATLRIRVVSAPPGPRSPGAAAAGSVRAPLSGGVPPPGRARKGRAGRRA